MKTSASFWTGRQVCVTGGTGFLGGHLVQQLLQRDAHVRVLALPPAPDHPLISGPRVEHVFGDLLDPATVRRAVADCTIIFHTAGLVATWGSALQRMHDVHVEGTRNVLACAEPQARIVHTSSVLAVGASTSAEPVTEESPFNLGTLPVDYVQAKRAAEDLALSAADQGLKVIVTNPSFLIGPEDHQHSILGRLCLRFWKGRVLLAPPGGINVVDVRDVAHGQLLAAEHGQPGRRYLLGGEDYSMKDFLGLLAQVAGFRPRSLPALSLWQMALLAYLAEARAWLTKREPFPSFQDLHISRRFCYCRSDRACAELGYTHRPLRETLADTYRWHCANTGARPRGVNRWWMRPQVSHDRAA